MYFGYGMMGAYTVTSPSLAQTGKGFDLRHVSYGSDDDEMVILKELFTPRCCALYNHFLLLEIFTIRTFLA